jgi:hypothetical protein
MTTRPKRPQHRPPKITPDTTATIANAIRAGSWDYEAAQAAGIHRQTFRYWMDRGDQAAALAAAGQSVPRADRPYLALCVAVTTARAAARVYAENRVYQENPLAWLRMGPGRHRGPTEPGWTDRVEVEHSGEIATAVVWVEDWRAGADPPE